MAPGEPAGVHHHHEADHLSRGVEEAEALAGLLGRGIWGGKQTRPSLAARANLLHDFQDRVDDRLRVLMRDVVHAV